MFNLAESFAGNDTADYCIAAYWLLGKRFTGSGSYGLLRAGQGGGQEDPRIPRHSHPGVRALFRGRLDFSHDLTFPVIVSRRAGSTDRDRVQRRGQSIRELMERIDWLHANFNSPVLIEEYVEGRRSTWG